jgi:hypothetical protein
MKAVGETAGILRCALNDNEGANLAMATLLSGLGNDERRKRLKLRPQLQQMKNLIRNNGFS